MTTAMQWMIRIGVFAICVATTLATSANPKKQATRPNFADVVSTISIRHVDAASSPLPPKTMLAQLPWQGLGNSDTWHAPKFSTELPTSGLAFPIPFRNFVSYVNATALTSQQSSVVQAALLQLLDDDDDSDTSLYQYDANGRLTIVGSLGGDARSYNYDALGNLQNVASIANTLTPPSAGGGGTPPSITGFNPTGGGAGTSVAVSGSGFLPIAGQTIVSLGGTIVTPSTLTNSQIVFAVPAGQGTAPIRIITPFGSTASANFTVPISGVTLTNTVALTTGGSGQTLSLSAANTSAAFSFLGQVNSWMSLQLSALSVTPSGASVSYTIYNPNNQSIATGVVSSSVMSVHMPPLPTTGTYLVVFNSGNNTNVSITAAISIDPQVAPGSSLSASIAVAGQTQRVQFLGVGGQMFVLDATLQSISVAGASLSATDITPAGGLGYVLGTAAVGNTISAMRLKNYSGGVLLSLSSNAT